MMNLNKGEVHIWYKFISEYSSPLNLIKHYSYLTESEKKKCYNFKFRKDRNQYIITRSLIRNILSFYIENIETEEWLFSYGEYGKPFILNENDFFTPNFNISHTQGLIAIGVSKCYEIGVDVEYKHRKVDYRNLASRCFSTQEIQGLSGLEEYKVKEQFLALWTLKEAYLKAKGVGLSMPLDKISFNITRPDKIELTDLSEKKNKDDNYYFSQIQLSEDHTSSIAVNTKEEMVNNIDIVKVCSDTLLSEKFETA